MTNPYLTMSDEERAEHKRLQEEADNIKSAVKDIYAARIIKNAIQHLKDRNLCPEVFAEIPQQAYPREANLAKPADLSETQIQTIKTKADADMKNATFDKILMDTAAQPKR